MLFIVCTLTFNKTEYISKTDTFIEFYPLVIGFPMFLSIYYNDFKSKSMQIAIGYGISKGKVILIKSIEYVILSTISAALLCIITLVFPLFLQMSFTNIQLAEVILYTIIGTLKIIGYMSISTVLFIFHKMQR